MITNRHVQAVAAISVFESFLPTVFGFVAPEPSHNWYTSPTHGQRRNIGLLLLNAAVMIFMIGLIPWKIAALNYKDQQDSSGHPNQMDSRE